MARHSGHPSPYLRLISAVVDSLDEVGLAELGVGLLPVLWQRTQLGGGGLGATPGGPRAVGAVHLTRLGRAHAVLRGWRYTAHEKLRSV